MDGEVTFSTNEHIEGISTLSVLKATFNQPVGGDGSSENAGTQSVIGGDGHARTSMNSPGMRWASVGAAMVATVAAASVNHLLLTKGPFSEQAIPDVVALLVFLLASAPLGCIPEGQTSARIRREFESIAPALIAACLLQACLLWWTGSRGMPIATASCLWFTFVAVGIIAARRCSESLLDHPKIEQRLTRRAAIIGFDQHAARIVECYARQPLCGVHVMGVFADVPGACEGFTPDGSIADLLDISARSRVDAIIIALPPGLGHEREIPGLVWRLRSVAADLFVAPYLMHGPNILLPIQAIGPLSFTVLQRRPLNDLQAIRKFVFDYVLCLALLIPFLVFFLLVVIAIKLDSPGPALFRQPRFGLNNRRFTIFKFRSMYADQADLVAARQTSRGDPRVTRVGKWLRRFSIDEMPQIFNVLRGEMSLVGPRPHAPQTRIEGELLDNVLVDYVMRYRVKPGITGLAQVNGARGQLLSSEDLRRRVRFDLEYIKRWSLALDIKIIALTVLREFVSKNAF